MFNGRDGISLVSRVAAEQLGAAGFKVDAYSLCAESSKEVPRNTRLWTAENGAFKFSAKLLQVAGNGVEAGTIVLAMHVHLAPAAFPFIWRGARLSVFLHGIEAWKPLRMRERIAINAAHSVIANSQATVDRFKIENPKFVTLPVHVCPLGISPLEVPAEGPSLALNRFALIVGRLVGASRYKGHDELLEVWGAVMQRAPGLNLVIAGDGPDRSRLEAKANSLNLNGRVTFTGFVNDQELQRLYRDCEFFIMPSTGEGFGLVYLEAMRAAKACIAAPGAAESVVENERTGIIVDPSSREQLLDAILRLATQPGLRDKFGNAGCLRFKEEFTASRFGNKLIAALTGEKAVSAKCVE